MRGQAQYIVRGNSELASLSGSDDILKLFCEAISIRSPEGGCRDPWTKEDYILRVKIFFLMDIYDEYSHNEELSEFFPSSGLDETFFDKYWDIFPVEDSIRMPAFGEKFESCGKLKRADIESTSNELVEGWLSSTVSF